MSKATGLIIFALGAAIGSAITWQYTKKYYEQRSQEDIDSVKETYEKRYAAKKEEPKIKTETEESTEKEKNSMTWIPDVAQYNRIMNKGGYISKDTSPTSKSKPYVISPDEFGEDEEYSQISLTLYSDGVLADENDEQIVDVDGVVGAESLTHFGEYEDDSVFVRNDQLKCDYEILTDTRTYSEVLKRRPHRKGVK